jgi:hypothetical protein
VFPSTDPARSDLLDNQEMQRSDFRQPALPAGSEIKASNPAMTQQQIKDQDDQQNAAYADPATVTVTPIAETAAEQQEQYEDDQKQVHLSLQYRAAGTPHL